MDLEQGHPDEQGHAGKRRTMTRDAEEIAAADEDPIAQAIAIMAHLRSPEGCPWDREQSFDTIKRHTLEEVYEVFDAIERRDWTGLQDELGDLLLQVLFYSQMARDEGRFDIYDVARGLSAKLIRRHPHIFAGVEISGSGEVLRNWEQIKREERRKTGGAAPGASLLEEIPRSMPALMEAGKLGSKAAKVGFDWPDSRGLFAKLREEVLELEHEVKQGVGGDGRARQQLVEDELGDVLFTAVNLARHLRIDPEGALRLANAKFRRRFAAMEEAAGGAQALEGSSAEELEERWQKAKRQSLGTSLA